MPGLNASLYLGLSGLQAQQSALNVVGHNIANVNTPGYSRQRADLSSNQAVAEGQVYFGTGVSLNSVQGIRDRFLDLQIYQETARQTGATDRFSGVNSLSSSLGDTGSTGIAAQIQGFFQGFQELAARPEDTALRTNLLGKAQTMISGLQTRYRLLDAQRNSADQSVGSLVGEVNILTDQIARLNQRISTEASPGADNDARDQRKALTEKLSGLVGINVFEDAKGGYQISLDSGAVALVGGSTAYTLLRSQATTANVKEGQLGAKIDLRDNILVGFQNQLDQLAAGIASQVNLLHKNGVDLKGNPGLDFFGSAANGANGLPSSAAGTPPLYQGMVMALSVNPLIAGNPILIAAAGPGGAPGDNTNAGLLAKLQFDGGTNAAGVVLGSSFSTRVGSLVSDLGTQIQKFDAQSTTQQNLVSALQTQRDQISGVNLDEEASNMMTLQRGYQASARFINVINQLTDQLVNQFGR